MTKIINRILIFLVLCMGSFFAFSYVKGMLKNPFGVKTIETTHSLILEKTKSLGNLELVSYYYKDILDQKITRDYLPDPRALLIVYGEATGCINLTKIQDGNIEVTNEYVSIKLPKPFLCQYKIDHSKSTIYDTQYAFMNEALLLEEAYKSAEQKLKETALDSGILKQTENNARNMLIPIFENISGKKVSLEFE